MRVIAFARYLILLILPLAYCCAASATSGAGGGAVWGTEVRVRNSEILVGERNQRFTDHLSRPWTGTRANGTSALAENIDHVRDANFDRKGIAASRAAMLRRRRSAEPYWMVRQAADSQLQDVRSASQASSYKVFPTDSFVNVKTYGAKGDGIADDTVALQRAIEENHGKMLYFPRGTYVVSASLEGKKSDGTWYSAEWLLGENKDKTIIKLKDDNAWFQDPTHPAAVVRTASLEPLNKINGGGNNGFFNYIDNITIDVGSGNPGAVGVDFQGNNICGMSDVTIRSSDREKRGVAGVSMLRYATGPCLFKKITIDGFDYGLEVDHLDYSITAEQIKLYHQRKAGIRNNGDVISIRALETRDDAIAISNEAASGLITLVEAKLRARRTSSSAIENRGSLFAREVVSSGYRTVIANHGEVVPGSTVSEYVSSPPLSLFSSNLRSLNLPIKDTPSYHDLDMRHWASVRAYGAKGDGIADDTSAIQAALDAGATTVYFPTGTYNITSTLRVRANVRRVEGFLSTIMPIGWAFQNANAPLPAFRLEGSAAVELDHLELGNWQQTYPGTDWIENASAHTVAVKHVDFAGGYHFAYSNTRAGTGDLFLEDVSAGRSVGSKMVCGRWRFGFGQHVWARQFNEESGDLKILNSGATLWILGLKTENTQGVIDTMSGGKSEVLGGLLYPLHSAGDSEVAFRQVDANASYTVASTAYKPGYDYQSFFAETHNGVTKTLGKPSLRSRGYGAVVPLYVGIDATNR